MKLPILGLLLVCSTALSNAGFEEAAHYSEETGGNALLVWDNGTVRSSLKPGWSLRTAQPVFSITKTLTALAWLHRFEPGAPVGDGLTSSSLLSQTSGLDPGYRELYRSNLEDLHAVAKRIPRISAPEIGFVYGPSHYERLGIALPGKEDVIDFVERGLGIRPATWKRDAKGAPFLSTGARLSAQDLLTAGLVVLNGGRAGPWRRAVPASRMRKALTGTTANPAYGLGFWLNVNASLGDARGGYRTCDRARQRRLEALRALSRGSSGPCGHGRITRTKGLCDPLTAIGHRASGELANIPRSEIPPCVFHSKGGVISTG